LFHLKGGGFANWVVIVAIILTLIISPSGKSFRKALLISPFSVAFRCEHNGKQQSVPNKLKNQLELFRNYALLRLVFCCVGMHPFISGGHAYGNRENVLFPLMVSMYLTETVQLRIR